MYCNSCLCCLNYYDFIFFCFSESTEKVEKLQIQRAELLKEKEAFKVKNFMFSCNWRILHDYGHSIQKHCIIIGFV